jgi:prolyl 4-hydroxylase
MAWWILIVLVVLLSIWFLNLKKRSARGYTPVSATWDPPIQTGPILTTEECKAIIDYAEPKFTRSTLVAAEAIDNTRTSETAWLPRDHELSRKIIARAQELTGKPFENCEDIQVVRYKPGTYYRPHHDSCCEDNEPCINFEDEGGQRVGTVLVYLNDDFENGFTGFPNYNQLRLKAPPGEGIFFRPLGRDDWRCHPYALHAGEPVTSGIKYLCNVWIRESRYK